PRGDGRRRLRPLRGRRRPRPDGGDARGRGRGRRGRGAARAPEAPAPLRLRRAARPGDAGAGARADRVRRRHPEALLLRPGDGRDDCKGDNMKLSFNSWVYCAFPAWLPLRSLEDTIDVLAEIGYDGIEIGAAAPHGFPAYLD